MHMCAHACVLCVLVNMRLYICMCVRGMCGVMCICTHVHMSYVYECGMVVCVHTLECGYPFIRICLLHVGTVLWCIYVVYSI